MRRPPARRAGAALELEPGPVFAQIVEQQPRLALQRDEPGQPLELAHMEEPFRDRDSKADRPVRRDDGSRLDLVDRETELVEPADRARTAWRSSGRRSGSGQLLPQHGVAAANGLGRLDRIVAGPRPALHQCQVGKTERDVLDEDSRS